MNEDITVLYVDDELINLKIFEINFKKKYQIITALSGDKGLAKLEENKAITIVISDMKMPGMSGIEFIRIAKQKHLNIVCFILTGFDITEEISAALEEGIIRKYFKKPFNTKDIEAAIKETIN